MANYSILALARNALQRHRNWPQAWGSPVLRPSYDAVIIGGGGHGLATAYYLAKLHGMRNIAVLEKGWIGGGNTGRNTTIVRSNYLNPESAGIYEHALKLWEGLSQELNFNVMFSQRGVINLAHDPGEERELRRRIYANQLAGVDAEWVGPTQLSELCPILNLDPNIRYPVVGGTLQRRAGVARHDAVAWGYARGADHLGVHIIQNCEVTGFDIREGRIEDVLTSQGDIKTPKVGVVASGHSSLLAAMADIRLPLESHPLQALVSEPVKPIMPTVIMSNKVHAYMSQSDKGELVIGAGIDGYISYAQRGSLPVIEETIRAIVELFPITSRLKMMRQWAGIVDICPDASPIISGTPVKGLYFNCGWGTGGFKATPGSGHVFAHTLAKDAPHPLNAPFALERFYSGALVAEHGAAAVAH